MIRTFSDKDAERCREILNICLEESVNLEERMKLAFKENFTKEGWLESGLLFVYEKNGKILGMGGLNKNEIEKLYIDPKTQGRGVGKEILYFLEKIAKEKGYDELVLHSWTNSEGFYEKYGYKTVEILYYDYPDGLKIPATEMRKKI